MKHSISIPRERQLATDKILLTPRGEMWHEMQFYPTGKQPTCYWAWVKVRLWRARRSIFDPKSGGTNRAAKSRSCGQK